MVGVANNFCCGRTVELAEIVPRHWACAGLDLGSLRPLLFSLFPLFLSYFFLIFCFLAIFSAYLGYDFAAKDLSLLGRISGFLRPLFPGQRAPPGIPRNAQVMMMI